VLVRVLMPVLTFTCEEVWHFMPDEMRDAESVQLTGWPLVEVPAEEAAALSDAYATVMEAREVVTKALEEARNDKVMGKSQEASVLLTAPASAMAALEARAPGALAELFIVAGVTVVAGSEYSAAISAAGGDKCPRCWNIRELGLNPAHPEVCARCAEVLDELA
jgi:isoleucyl-tRNA synthetase